MRRLWRYGRRGALVVLAIAFTLLAVRVWDSQRGPPLEPWHTFVPQEMSVAAIDAADWQGYLRAEAAVFEAVRREVTQKLGPDERVPFNRYFAQSPVYPGNLPSDWNRSYLMEPDGPPVGAAVMLHGLTDSPYSLRHVAARYRDRGYAVVAIRLPAHGTVPAALSAVEWPEWSAAVRLAVREALRLAGPDTTLHLVGFSNGGALALKYALDALEDPGLRQADQLVLISPMVGITAFARFAGLAGLPAYFSRWAKAAWIARIPEFNPFKYNSFPINGAQQSHRVTMALQGQLRRFEEAGRLGELPPILTFQSVVDFTVSTAAVVSALHARLPAGRSELVLFDANRSSKFGPLLRAEPQAVLDRLLPAAPRGFATTIVTNADPDDLEVVALTTPAGASSAARRRLGLQYPPDVFSLSHVALPFPLSDSLYGLRPEPADAYGISLGAMATRGERGILVVSMDALLRMASNPFFPYMLERIEAVMGPGAAPATAAAGPVSAPARR